jgi:tRNA-2-methylthio-N6-dimethylallyladenosine synthase
VRTEPPAERPGSERVHAVADDAEHDKRESQNEHLRPHGPIRVDELRQEREEEERRLRVQNVHDRALREQRAQPLLPRRPNLIRRRSLEQSAHPEVDEIRGAHVFDDAERDRRRDDDRGDPDRRRCDVHGRADVDSCDGHDSCDPPVLRALGDDVEHGWARDHEQRDGCERKEPKGVRIGHGYHSDALRRYHVTTFGCQMNAHDTERIKGMLEELGLGEASAPEAADVLVFNTCTIRDKPDQRLAAHLGNARALKERDPERVIAVGGCYAEAQRERIFSRYPFVDVAFGPGSIAHLAEWLGAGGVGVARGSFGTAAERRFAATLPSRRQRQFQAWVQVSMGCNSKCAYCIVPAVRGRELSRRPEDVVGEVAQLAAAGVKEVTLLGQNVNSWGRDLRPELDTDFGELLHAVDAVDGIERIRFTSPHPKDFRENVISALAACRTVCEHVHLPLQSGSTRVLKAMRRTYTRERYLALVETLRAAVPDLALGTDIIVGFPGETDDDFLETLEMVETVGFDSAFTFVYSPRAGTEAAAMSDQVPDTVKRDRIERLVDTVQRVALERNRLRIGRHEEVLVEGASRTDPARMRGRTRRNTTVNFVGTAKAGELIAVEVEAATSTTLSGRQRALVAA